MNILKNEGYAAVELVEEQYISVKVDGRSYLLINMEDGDLVAYFGMTGVLLSHQDMNDWNREKRLSRAYIDDDNDPVLESDLLANGGMSHEHVAEFFRVFVESATIFRNFIFEHDKSEEAKDPSASQRSY